MENKLLLAGIAALACTVVNGQDKPAEKPAFEVASIKPAKTGQPGMVRVEIDPGGRFVVSNISLRMLIQQAYNIKDFQVTGAPAWANSERYDIVAKPEGAVEPGRDGLRPLIQSLLADRFKLTFHRETKELPTYSLVVAKSGPKLKESAAEQGMQRQMQRMGRGEVTLEGASMAVLVTMLAQQLGRNVIDKTGLTGRYDINLQWTPDESLRGPGDGLARPPSESAPPPDTSGPSLFTAVQEQLGLKLESAKGPVEIFVVDHAEKPTEN